MNGFATRNALHAINEHCAPGTEGFTQHSALSTQSSRDALPPAPTYLPNAHGLGTPGEVVRIAAIRRESLFRRVFWGGMAFVIVCGVFIVGFNVGHVPEPVTSGVAYRIKAQRLAGGQMRCELDRAEDCLVCMHRDTGGFVTVASHC